MTREEAIDVLKHNYPSACFTDLCEAVEIAIQALSAQPKQRWIPCSERLPEHGGWYITTYRNNRVGLLWYSTAHGWEWDNAIAWMPLPEPYGEVE